jgi:hypothetical protein
LNPTNGLSELIPELVPIRRTPPSPAPLPALLLHPVSAMAITRAAASPIRLRSFIVPAPLPAGDRTTGAHPFTPTSTRS